MAIVFNNLSAGGGGGSKLYRHTLYVYTSSSYGKYYIGLVCSVEEAFTLETFKEYLGDKGDIYIHGFNSSVNNDGFYYLFNKIFVSDDTVQLSVIPLWYDSDANKLDGSARNITITSLISDTVTEL